MNKLDKFQLLWAVEKLYVTKKKKNDEMTISFFLMEIINNVIKR
jgi:hypothetical protein